MRRAERRKLGWDWCLVLVVVLVGGCCLGSCLPVARRKVVLLRSGPGLDALGMQVVTLASQLGALLVSRYGLAGPRVIVDP